MKSIGFSESIWPDTWRKEIDSNVALHIDRRRQAQGDNKTDMSVLDLRKLNGPQAAYDPSLFIGDLETYEQFENKVFQVFSEYL